MDNESQFNSNLDIGGVRVNVIKGDITAMGVDAIVNAANGQLWMGGGVAGAIKHVGGQSIEAEAVSKGPIKVGEALMTSAGKLHSKSIRSMLCYSYGRFAAKLQSKAEQWKNVLVVRCSEAWTSKTASWNGFIDEKLNNKKHISSDGITLDRDVNGARGIFLRALRDSSLMNLETNHHAEQQF